MEERTRNGPADGNTRLEMKRTSPRTFAHFGALLFTALGLVPGAAHMLEMPPRMMYDAQMYMEVTVTLYPLYGSFGAFVQLFAILAVVLLTILIRKTRVFRVTLGACAFLLLSVGIWFFVVGPVNGAWMEAVDASPGTAPELFMELRKRWEYGNGIAFLSWFTGYWLLLYSVFLYHPRPD